jgi:uncharacterized protein (DUF58 family)
MAVSLTISGRLLLLSSIVLGVIAGVTGIQELAILAVFGLALVASASLWIRRKAVALEVFRKVPQRRAQVGQICTVELVVENSTSRAAAPLVMTDNLDGTTHRKIRVSRIPPSTQRIAQYRFLARRRGIATFGPATLTTVDPFGLTRATATLANRTEVLVGPQIHPLAITYHGAPAEPDADSRQRSAFLTATEEASSLRDYLPGDDVRRVHWPSTARLGIPVVRHYDHPWQPRTTVVLDTLELHHTSESLERAISAAASVIVACFENGEPSRLLISDGTDSGVIEDTHHLDALLNSLATLQPSSLGSLDGALRILGQANDGGRLVLCVGSPSAEAEARVASRAAIFDQIVTIACGSGRPLTSHLCNALVPFGGSHSLVEGWNHLASQQRSIPR